MSPPIPSLRIPGLLQPGVVVADVLLLIMSLAVAACSGRNDTHAPLTLEGIEQAVMAHYQGRTLHLFGRVTSSLDTNVHRTDFTATASATTLSLQWSSLGFDPSNDSGGHLLIINGEGCVTLTVGTTVMSPVFMHASPDMALAGATGVSAGSAPVVNAIRVGDRTRLFPLKASLEEFGDSCLLSGLDSAGNRKVLTIKDHAYITLIHEELSTTRLTSVHPSLPTDDASIRKTLISMGSPATDQDIRLFKSEMVMVQKMMFTVKGPMLTDIVLSEQPLSPMPRPTRPAQPVQSPSAIKPHPLPLPDQLNNAMDVATQAQDSNDIDSLVPASIALSDVKIRIQEM